MKTSELGKKTKIDLLNAIRNGEVDPADLTADSIIVSDGKEAFNGLMANVAQSKAGKKNTVIYIGAAKELMLKTLENITEIRDKQKQLIN